jgi:flagellar biosynthesis/type III secretory pathway M-ring protein FliF/YscJ
MLEEVKEDEEPVELELDKGEELEEDLSEKYSAMRKNVEMSLGLNETLNEDQVKYDLLVEEVTKYISEHTDEVSNLLQLLIDEESSAGQNQNAEKGSKGR